MLNSPLFRAYNHSPTPKGGTQHQALARSRGGLITKIQMVADVLAGQPLIEVFQATAVPADKAYDTGVFVRIIAESDPEAAIPNPPIDHSARPHGHPPSQMHQELFQQTQALRAIRYPIRPT